MQVSSEQYLLRSDPAAAAGAAALVAAALNGRAVTPPGGWEAAWGAAAAHGLAAFLYPFVRDAPPEGRPPDTVAEAWRGHFVQAVQTEARVTAQAAELLQLLAAARVPCIPIKGIWLSHRVYPHAAGRTMADLDVLVPVDGVASAAAALAAAGYEGPEGPLPYAADIKLRHPRRPRPVELHWQFGSERMPLVHQPPVTPLWERAAPGQLLGQPVLALPAEEHVCVVVYHLVHHLFGLSLRSYLDLALLVRSGGAELAAGLAPALPRWGMARPASLALGVVEELLGVPPPAGLELAETGVERREEAIRLALAPPGGEAVTAATSFVELRERHGLGRIAWIGRRIFMPADFMRQQDPAAASAAGLALAYGRRAWRLVRQHRRTIRQLFAGRSARGGGLDAAAKRVALVRWALEPAGHEDAATAASTGRPAASPPDRARP